MTTTYGPSRLARTAVLAAAGLTIMAPAVIAPSLPAMVEHYEDQVLVQLSLTVTSLAIAVGAPLAGTLADRLGRRPVLLGGLVLNAVAGSAGLVVADLGTLITTRAVLGLAVGAVTTSVATLLTDWFAGPRRAAYLGFQQAAASLGGVVLLPLAGILADASWRAPFWLYTVAVPVAVLALVTVRDTSSTAASVEVPTAAAAPSSDNEGRRATAGRTPGGGPTERAPWRVAGLYLLALASTAVFYMAPAQLPFLLDGLGVGAALTGVAIAGTTLTGLVGSLAFPAVRRRISPTAVTVTGLAALGAGWILVGLADGLPLALVGLLAGGLGVGLTVPNLNLRLGELAPVAQRGRVLAGLVSSIFLGQFLSPIAVGTLAAGLSDTFIWAGLLAATAAAIAAPLLLRPHHGRYPHA
ncbi:MFS transporter [Promicromonospora panici]|uniref:MFS transporter n=1 Tax=Promicromonospora panici TaxID=2219658 RepID=UPI00101E0872|nr:MFS transporter [Promicromonospora panici]